MPANAEVLTLKKPPQPAVLKGSLTLNIPLLEKGKYLQISIPKDEVARARETNPRAWVEQIQNRALEAYHTNPKGKRFAIDLSDLTPSKFKGTTATPTKLPVAGDSHPSTTKLRLKDVVIPPTQITLQEKAPALGTSSKKSSSPSNPPVATLTMDDDDIEQVYYSGKTVTGSGMEDDPFIIAPEYENTGTKISKSGTLHQNGIYVKLELTSKQLALTGKEKMFLEAELAQFVETAIRRYEELTKGHASEAVLKRLIAGANTRIKDLLEE